MSSQAERNSAPAETGSDSACAIEGSKPSTEQGSTTVRDSQSPPKAESGPAAEAKAGSPEAGAAPGATQAPARAISTAETTSNPLSQEADQHIEQAPESAAPSHRSSDEAHDGLDRAYAYSGMACMGAGVVVGVLSLTSLAANLDSLGNPKLVALALAVCGALLFGIGRVRRMLRGVESALAGVRKQTDRLDEVVREGDELRREVGDVSGSTSVLRAEVGSLQAYLENLTQIVSNPEIQVSMFHLAASQDRIAKHLDVTLTERFNALYGEISKRIEAVARAQDELQGSVDALESRAADQLTAQAARLERALEGVLAATGEHAVRLDRVDGRVKESSQELLLAHETVLEGLTRASEANDRHARAAAAGLDKLRDQLEARLQGQSKVLDGQLERVRADLEQRLGRVEGEQARSLREVAQSVHADLEQRLGHAEAEQARALREVAATLRSELDERAKSIRQGVDTVGGNLSRAQTALASELQALAPLLEQRIGRVESEQVRALRELAMTLRAELEEHVKSLREGLDASAEALGRSQAGLASELQALTPRIERRLHDEAGSLLADLQAWAHAGQTAVKEGMDELRANAQTTQHEINAGLARVAPQIDSRLGEHTERMASETGRLAGKLDELSSAHVALSHESSQAAGRLDVELAAFGQRLTQGLGRIDDAQSAMLSEITGRLAADRLRSERALQEGLRSIETSAERAQQELSKGFAGLAPALTAELDTQIALQAELRRSHVQSDRLEELLAEIHRLARRIETLQSTDHPLLEGSLDGLARSGGEHTETLPAAHGVRMSPADRPELPLLRIEPICEPPAALPRDLQGRSAEARTIGEAASLGAAYESHPRQERPAPMEERSAIGGESDTDLEC